MSQSFVFPISATADHIVVFQQEDTFAGWPANRGVWNWGDEILVGFVVADHMNNSGSHSRDPLTSRNKFARSFDGGSTWTIEEGHIPERVLCSDANFSNVKSLTVPVEDFTDPNLIISMSFCNKDTGPSYFYTSKNRGHNWDGPYIFPNLNKTGVATRTNYVIDGSKNLGVLLTVAKNNSKEGRVLYARTEDGALSWNAVSYVGSEPDGFDIMPSAVRFSSDHMYTVIRTRTVEGLDLLTAYSSKDNGDNWVKLKNPVQDTGIGGSPPALLLLNDGRLALSYVFRSVHGSRLHLKFSSDNGQSWGDDIMLRGGDGANRDVGYPVMVQVEDGNLVIIYYWNHENSTDSSPFRYIAATIINPEIFQ